MKNIDLNQLKGLDVNNIGNWPALPKALAIAFVCLLVVGLVYYLDTSAQLDELAAEERKETDLRSEFENKQRKAANLQAYEQQMQQMQEAFKDLLRQLPKGTEVPNLLDEVSYAISGAGLINNKFKQLPDVKQEFYIESPIEISIAGSYHQIGEFVSRVSALPRIVTIHDFTLKSTAKPGDIDNSDMLTMDLIAKTYRYDSGEESEGDSK